jgi:rhamnogalacturonan endolyase
MNIAFLIAATLSASAQTEQTRRDSAPRLVRKLDLRDFGAKFVRLGDLDGDGVVDLLFVQACGAGGENKMVVTCLTAVTLEGQVLWQSGHPDSKNLHKTMSDLPVQIHDLDGDGKTEVVYIPDEKNELTVLEGATGQVRRKIQLAGGHDSLLFADLGGNGTARDVVVKNRYTGFWVYDRDFRLTWSKMKVNTGHYPLEHDFDGDGRDELLVGYTLYDAAGKELWSLPGYSQEHHNDAAFIDDMDGDRRPEVAIATSKDAILLDADGKYLFRKAMDHCQHALIGRFRAGEPGRQAFYISRNGDPKASRYAHPKPGEPSRFSTAAMYTRAGDQLWTTQENIWNTGCLRMEHWTGNPDEHFILLYRRGVAPPCLLDGAGKEVAVFPFPPAILAPGQGPGGKDLYDDHYVHHVACWGDEREEVLVNNHKAVWIYTNAALNAKSRLYNSTYYPGRQ